MVSHESPINTVSRKAILNLVKTLAARPDVVAVGEYSYHGDQFIHMGKLDDEQARAASIMCRAANMSVHMQANILQLFCEDCGVTPAKGWAVRGPRYSVCVMANVFCFVQNSGSSMNEVIALMRQELADAPEKMVY
jgi:roadblock/LC7 domain-containing protein